MQLLESTQASKTWLLDAHGHQLGPAAGAQLRYDAPDEGMFEDPYVIADVTLTKRIAEAIYGEYPEHPWKIEVSHAQRLAFLSIPPLMGANYKYVIHIADLKSDPGMRIPLRYAGEILERYKIPRSKFSAYEFREAIDRIPRFLRHSGRGLIPA